jgi:hypothetical protein
MASKTLAASQPPDAAATWRVMSRKLMPRRKNTRRVTARMTERPIWTGRDVSARFAREGSELRTARDFKAEELGIFRRSFAEKNEAKF